MTLCEKFINSASVAWDGMLLENDAKPYDLCLIVQTDVIDGVKTVIWRLLIH